MVGGHCLLRPGGGRGFSLDADAVERRSGSTRALERFLRAAQDR